MNEDRARNEALDITSPLFKGKEREEGLNYGTIHDQQSTGVFFQVYRGMDRLIPKVSGVRADNYAEVILGGTYSSYMLSLIGIVIVTVSAICGNAGGLITTPVPVPVLW
ncbi:hypothetical protein KQX54_005188 [Cotesia glomerata]|uniref:Uncharacterized protein n=1 Tax=Cotesia glomerata TaxID=32391 RepID=A0AAV7HY09_COTGL|nr:hypothetical protein KQX54_005188 [Cotesia glomerata]